MPASLWKSLIVRFMVPGHSLQEAECRAAVIVIDCLVISTIMGYRFSDGERKRLPAVYSGPIPRSLILSGHGGIFPDRVDRDRILFPCTRDPAGPASRGEYDGSADVRRISSAVCGTSAMVCW